MMEQLATAYHQAKASFDSTSADLDRSIETLTAEGHPFYAPQAETAPAGDVLPEAPQS